MISLDALEALARKATKGPWVDIHGADATDALPLRWQHNHELRQKDMDPTNKHHWPYRIAQTVEGQSAQQAHHDFAYLAACDPQTILELVSEINLLRGRLAAFQGQEN